MKLTNFKKLENERKKLEEENAKKIKRLEMLQRHELLMIRAAKEGELSEELLDDVEMLKDFIQNDEGLDEAFEEEEEEEEESVCDRSVASSAESSPLRGKERSEKTKKLRRSRSRSPRRMSRTKDSKSSYCKPSHRKIKRNRSRSIDPSPKLECLFQDARYFLIKSSNHENISLSQAKGVWSTPPPNEAKFNEMFHDHSNVILIFSVKESGKFQGFARVVAPSDRGHPPIRWVLPVGLSSRMLCGVFALDWISKRDLLFDKVYHLRNSLNGGRCVKVGRDGQELDAESGEALCRMFPRDEEIDLHSAIEKAKDALRRNNKSVGAPRTSSPRHCRHENYERRHHRQHLPTFEPEMRSRRRESYRRHREFDDRPLEMPHYNRYDRGGDDDDYDRRHYRPPHPYSPRPRSHPRSSYHAYDRHHHLSRRPEVLIPKMSPRFFGHHRHY